MSERRVAIVGAFDRFNYGDLLFPIVVRPALARASREPYEYREFALTNSDLRRYGAHATFALRDIQSFLRPNDVLLVAGGGVLGTRWSNMLIHSSDARTGFIVRAVRKLFGTRSADALARTITGNRSWRFPWIFEPESLGSDIAVVYNAVGGFGTLGMLSPDERKHVWKSLRTSIYVSVRDEDTRRLLAVEAGLQHAVLAPDSAVLMSDLFPLDDLWGRCSEETRAILHRVREGYVCVQISKAHAAGEVETIARQLETLYRTQALTTVLLPIGRAPGHEDQVALSRIAAQMHTPVHLPTDGIGVYDIMLLIARSRCFIGTSLHGAITALSFGAPHLGLSDKVMKLRNFLRTWDIPAQRECIGFDAIASSVHSVCSVPQIRRDEKRAELIAASWRNFDNIAGRIGNLPHKRERSP